MFYLTSKFHDNSVNTFESIEMGAPPLTPLLPSPGTPKKPRRNRVRSPKFILKGQARASKGKGSWEGGGRIWIYGFSIRLEKILLLIGWVTITSLEFAFARHFALSQFYCKCCVPLMRCPVRGDEGDSVQVFTAKSLHFC